MDIHQLRKDYQNEALCREMLAADPMEQFANWFQEACAAQLLEPNV